MEKFERFWILFFDLWWHDLYQEFDEFRRDEEFRRDKDRRLVDSDQEIRGPTRL